ncbi:ChrR Cupin-like domain-containing protein [Planifilum fulgidum]|jgi:quercetin dioxygenase-like cupin family protein|uniref:ChrR Cupin-like domain-containing protein n=1 Tax=Planifilum fulgidum TaxID=201973 RepID=A0A1I2MQE0_9BACL|nr:cupin domain-containing protein [Planifilum fulgidum]MBO2496257.1 cupin domain-containing protein [Bacillota bacterium]MBO2532069.1 anti-sigma factor [Thermoactinomycetaceae bacterium]SFF93100.1 ChrR Cupin-like domain-containing protein [Planifilum fulgidum]
MEGPYVIRKGDGNWIPMGDGVRFSYLRRYGEEYSILLEMDAGGRFPGHDHVGGEEIFVLEGSVRLGTEELRQGDYYYLPPGVSHPAETEEGCSLLITSARGLETGEKQKSLKTS